jgi:two-component system nitrogen regulation response regulator NtrX
MHTILVVDDDKEICKTLKSIFLDEGFKVHVAQTPEEAVKKIKTEHIHLILLDVWFGKDSWDGVNLLERIKQFSPVVPIIMISGHATLELAVKAIKKGAYDFLEKPFDLDRLLLCVRHALEHTQLRIHRVTSEKEEASWPFPLPPALMRFTSTDARVLILGENGTGKTAITKEIVKHSFRKDAPVLMLDADMLNALSESTLLGEEHAKVVKQIGIFEQAQGGTIILRNVDNLSLALQKMMTRVWDVGGVVRLNGQDLVPLNVRFLATAQESFFTLSEHFLKEFFDRITLNHFSIKPLRHSREEIRMWVEYLLPSLNSKHHKNAQGIEDAMLCALQAYEWPGNITQLANVLENAVIVSHGTTLTVENFTLPIVVSSGSVHQDLFNLSLMDARCMFEYFYIASRLTKENGNVSRVAKEIGMERSALHRKIKHLEERRIDINRKSSLGAAISSG